MDSSSIYNCVSSTWRWKTNLKNDHPSWLLLFTLSGILAATWYAWMKMKKSQKTTTPPLPPGPMGLPLVGNLLSLYPEFDRQLTGLAHTYGPIFKLRLGTKICIVVNSPSAAREILKDHDAIFANRDIPVAALTGFYGGSDIVWSPHGPEWRMLRRVGAHKMLGTAALDSVQAIRQKQVRKTVSYLYSRVGSPVDLGEQIFLTILNVITNMAWGGSIVAEDGEERAAGLGAELRKVVFEMGGLLSAPNVSDFFPILSRFDLQGINKRMKRLAPTFDEIFEEMINQRLRIEEKGTKESPDFLTFLLKLIDVGEGGDSKSPPMTMNHVKALLMDMVIGATETTPAVIEFAMTAVLNKPALMEKAQQELQDVVGNDNTVQESHNQKLPYLQAVFKETMRLFPGVINLLPHSPSETCTVGGYTIPKGSHVLVNVLAIHRDPCNWENPLEFDPNRFLGLDSNWDYSGRDFKYLPFGSGRRICPGIAMAERLVMLSLATLLHSFDWKVPLGEKFGIELGKMTPLVAIPTPRLLDRALYE